MLMRPVINFELFLVGRVAEHNNLKAVRTHAMTNDHMHTWNG